MIRHKLQRPKKEEKVGLTLRLDEAEYSFLHEVKIKRGCTIAQYIRFLIHRHTYEDLKLKSKTEQNQARKAMETINLLLYDKKLTKNYRLMITKSERDELERVKLERGISMNTLIRWLLRRRMAEFKMLGGELFEIV